MNFHNPTSTLPQVLFVLLLLLLPVAVDRFTRRPYGRSTLGRTLGFIVAFPLVLVRNWRRMI